jgi:general secretion pathway protein N
MIRRGAVMVLAMAVAGLAATAAAASVAPPDALNSLEHAAGPADPGAPPPAGRAAAAGRDFGHGNPLWSITLQSLTMTRDRPLFSPTRRPPPPPAVAAASKPRPPAPHPAEPDHPLLSLVGTIIGDAARIGVFADQTTKDVIRLRTGEGRAGWILLSVEPRKATFKKDALQATLTFPDSRSAQKQGGPAPASLDGNGRPVAAAPQQAAPSVDTATAAQSPAVPLPDWLRSDTVRTAPALTQTSLQNGPSNGAPLPDWLRDDGRSAPPPTLP